MIKANAKSSVVKLKKQPLVKKISKKEVVLPKIKKVIPPPSKIEKVAKPAKPISKAKTIYLYANGKRKTSVATVRLFSKGSGNITVNERVFDNYFPVITDQDKILSPLRITGTYKLFDISVRVHGGGIHSQAEAVRHAVSKALLSHDPLMRTTLKHAGYLTRDSRVKERKKYGLKRARRAPQWQKR